MVTKGERCVCGGKDKLGGWDKHIHTTIYKIDNPDLLIAQGTLLSTL